MLELPNGWSGDFQASKSYMAATPGIPRRTSARPLVGEQWIALPR